MWLVLLVILAGIFSNISVGRVKIELSSVIVLIKFVIMLEMINRIIYSVFIINGEVFGVWVF